MVIVFHGDDRQQSRTKLEELIQGKDGVLRFDSTTLADTIIDSINAQELFASSKIIVISQILGFSKLDLKKLNTAILEKEKSKEIEIILWQDEILPPSFLKQFSSAKVQLFSLPKYYFLFLDGIVPGNTVALKHILTQLSKTASDTQIFYSIIKRVRQLLITKSGDSLVFDEFKNMSSWQLSKLKKQASFWKEKDLLSLYTDLFRIEKDMKTSNLPLPLLDHIDILLYHKLH